MINEVRAAALNKELSALLNEFAAKHGLRRGALNMKYSSATFKITAEFGDTDETGDYNPAFMRDLQRHGWQYNLETSHLMKEVTLPSMRGMLKLKFVGMKGRTKVVMEGADGKLFLYDATLAARAIVGA